MASPGKTPVKATGQEIHASPGLMIENTPPSNDVFITNPSTAPA